MPDIGGVLREEVRSANGLSSSNGDGLNGETLPKPADAEKSPGGGDDIGAVHLWMFVERPF